VRAEVGDAVGGVAAEVVQLAADQVEPARAARLRASGVEAELLEPAEVRALEPALTGELRGATLVPGDLQCDPRAIARALAREAAAGAAA
jgi:glycine/D-amino acid oxidase-like deaminating enzyme